MNLEKMVEIGWLEKRPSSAQEIRDQLAVADRCIKDAEVTATSNDGRFVFAYTSAINSATAAMRAAGYRVRGAGDGRHAKIIDTLEHTVEAGNEKPKMKNQLDTFRTKRHKTIYEVADSVSDKELESAIRLAKQLRAEAEAWIANNHSELLR